MSYSQLVSSDQVPEQYRGVGTATIRQNPFRGKARETHTYQIITQRPSRRKSIGSPCEIMELELVFEGVKPTFADTLRNFADDTSSKDPFELHYTNTKRLLIGILGYIDRKNVEGSVQPPEELQPGSGIEGIIDNALNLVSDSIAYNSPTHLEARKVFTQLAQLYWSLPQNTNTVHAFRITFTEFEDQLAESKRIWSSYVSGRGTEDNIEELMSGNVRRLFSGLDVGSSSILRYLRGNNVVDDYPKFDRFERK